MHTIELYKKDAYQKNCPSLIKNFGEDWVQLDQTVFFAEGGGQSGDTGFLLINSKKYFVINTSKDGEFINHLLKDKHNLKKNTNVECFIDWERRYKLMKIHTCLHLLCSIIKSQVTGGSVNDGKGRLDFNLDQKPDKEKITYQLNNLINKNLDVKETWITDEELDKKPHLVRTMSVLPPRGSGLIRMVDIGDGVDFQPCGGTHVKNTSEIGEIQITKVENKGKKNKRVIVSLL